MVAPRPDPKRSRLCPPRRRRTDPRLSGKHIRYRLDRGGDRRLNRALHTIVLSRRQHDPATIAYIERRQAEGKTVREAIRCLKRFLARSLYRKLETMPSIA